MCPPPIDNIVPRWGFFVPLSTDELQMYFVVERAARGENVKASTSSTVVVWCPWIAVALLVCPPDCRNELVEP